MFRTIATIERSRSLTIFRIILTTTSAPTGGRTRAGIPAGIAAITGVTPTNTGVTTTNTGVMPKNTGGGAQRRTPRLRRGWLWKTDTTAREAMIPAALEATITA